MKIGFSLAVLLVLMLNSSFAQSSSSSAQKTVEVSLDKKMEGTYEKIQLDPKITEVFTDDILKVIEAKREEHTDVYYEVSKYTAFRIYSRDKINSDLKRKNK